MCINIALEKSLSTSSCYFTERLTSGSWWNVMDISHSRPLCSTIVERKDARERRLIINKRGRTRSRFLCIRAGAQAGGNRFFTDWETGKELVARDEKWGDHAAKRRGSGSPRGIPAVSGNGIRDNRGISVLTKYENVTIHTMDPIRKSMRNSRSRFDKSRESDESHRNVEILIRQRNLR